jgi:hypothetical protein
LSNYYWYFKVTNFFNWFIVRKHLQIKYYLFIYFFSLENVAASLTNGFKNCKSSINRDINLGAYVLAKVTDDSIGDKGY